MQAPVRIVFYLRVREAWIDLKTNDSTDNEMKLNAWDQWDWMALVHSIYVQQTVDFCYVHVVEYTSSMDTLGQ